MKIFIDVNRTIGNELTFYKAVDLYEYKNNVRTDKLEGSKVIVIDEHFDKRFVKLIGVSADSVNEVYKTGDKIKFDNLIGLAYMFNHRIMISLKADGIGINNEIQEDWGL